MTVVWGILADATGSAWSRELVQGRNGPETRMKVWSSAAAEYRAVQPAFIGVDLDHRRDWVGRVLDLQLRHGNLWCIAEVDDGIEPAVNVRVGDEVVSVPHDLFFSAEWHRDDGDGIVLDAVSLVAGTARVGARPVEFLHGRKLDYREAPSRWQLRSDFARDLLTRSANALWDRREHGGPIIIDSDDDPDTTFAPGSILPRHVEIRSAQVADVHSSRRELDVIVAPSGIPATIYERGRNYVETLSHGCFAGAEKNPQAVKVNIAHDRERVVGRAIHLDPFDPAGLVGTLKLSRTTAADDLLELASDDLIGVSAGFAVPAGGDEWDSSRQRRRVKRAILDHIAVTADPAYAAARITSVRSQLADIR